MIKNTASQNVCFQMISIHNGSAITSGTPTVYVLGDGGTQNTGSGSSTHEGNGCWSYAPTQAETNYSHIAFTMVLNNAVNQTVNIYPDAAYDVVNDGTYGNSAIETLIDDLESRLTATRAGYLDNLVNLDATISSRNSTTPPSVNQIADAVLQESIDDHKATANSLAEHIDEIQVDTNELQTDNIPSRLTDIEGGSFTTSTDSLEAIRNHIGDGTNLTEVGGDGDHLTAINLPNQTIDITGTIDTVTSVTNQVTADMTAISGSTDAADKLEASAETIEIGTASGNPTTTTMPTNLSEATNEHYNGRIIIWTSGVLLRQATNITNYDGATGTLTFTAVTEVPSNGDTFVIV